MGVTQSLHTTPWLDVTTLLQHLYDMLNKLLTLFQGLTDLTVFDDVGTCYGVVFVAACVVMCVPLASPRTRHTWHAPGNTIIWTQIRTARKCCHTSYSAHAHRNKSTCKQNLKHANSSECPLQKLWCWQWNWSLQLHIRKARSSHASALKDWKDWGKKLNFHFLINEKETEAISSAW